MLRIILILTCCLFLLIRSYSQNEIVKATFTFDHIVVFAHSEALEDSLKKNIFTLADKLTTQHKEQGTLGQYYLFYNTFIEFLYLEDRDKAVANEKRFGSAYTKRWGATGNSCPIAFGLNANPFDTATLYPQFIPYHSLDAPAHEFYLMPVTNTQYDQPMIYVSMPHRAYKGFQSLDEIDRTVEEFKRADLKNYLTHPSGIKRLTSVVLKSPTIDTDSQNTILLNTLNKVRIEKDDVFSLTLIFDNHEQGKEYTVQDNFSLTIKY